jgi:hypothetical protein
MLYADACVRGGPVWGPAFDEECSLGHRAPFPVYEDFRPRSGFAVLFWLERATIAVVAAIWRDLRGPALIVTVPGVVVVLGMDGQQKSRHNGGPKGYPHEVYPGGCIYRLGVVSDLGQGQ